jgi:hypothetical protein
VVRRGSTKPTAQDAMNSNIKINRINFKETTGGKPIIKDDHMAPPITNPYDEIEKP